MRYRALYYLSAKAYLYLKARPARPDRDGKAVDNCPH
jgi:hypothetical protein